MKQIIKKNPPEFFEDWKARFISRNGFPPDYKKNFFGKIKFSLKSELLKEQGYICCYCMARVDFNSHIEHFIPQSDYDIDKDLDYNNMFISCNGYHDDHSHCGHKKGNWFDEENMLSPLDPDIENQFGYLTDGSIIPMNDKANENIIHLGLNSYSLIRARKAAIYMSGLFDEDLSDTALEDIICEFESRDDTGAFLPFCQAVIYCLVHNSFY